MNEPLSRIEQFKKSPPGTYGRHFLANVPKARSAVKKSRRLRP